jgi:uncharacterized protein (UPF0332 family)
MNAFLSELTKEGRLTLVEPSATLAHAYRKKSRNSLDAAKLLRENDLLEEATTMVYYSMYHEALSLFFLTGIKSENHTATILLLQDVFAIKNNPIIEAKRERIEKQYYADTVVALHDVNRLVRTAEEFIITIEDAKDHLTEATVRQHRKDFARMCC